MKQQSNTICKSDLLYCTHGSVGGCCGACGDASIFIFDPALYKLRGLGPLSSPPPFIFDPVLYKIDIIIIKECSLTIHTNIAKEL